jgi:hypothetical protein
MFEIPILLIIYNRPDVLSSVFRIIQEIKPSKIFVAADGPKDNDMLDIAKCNQTRKVVEDNINWNCQVEKLYSDINLGCQLGPAKAIDWFFDNVDKGIILEDDCVADLSFFPFCAELLDKYQDDERIMMISGNNVISKWDNDASYVFSKIGSCWGWATWKRAWNKFDVHMKLFPKAKENKIFTKIFKDINQAVYRELVCEKTFFKKIDAWDYAWTFARLHQSGLSIVPNVNLIKNIGFGTDATHTKNPDDKIAKAEVYSIDFPLKHPDFILSDDEFDSKVFYETINYRLNENVINYLINKIKKYVFKNKK